MSLLEHRFLIISTPLIKIALLYNSSLETPEPLRRCSVPLGTASKTIAYSFGETGN